MPTSPIVQLLFLLVLGGCGFAFWKGGQAERIGAGVVLANLIVTLGGGMVPTDARPIFGLVLDGATAVVMLGLALRYGSLWLGGAMLFYAAQFSLRAFYFVTERPHDNFHAIVNNINFMGILWCVVIGTAVAWRRRARASTTTV